MIIALSCLGYTAYYIVKTRAHDDIEAKLLSAAILITMAAMALHTYGLLQAECLPSIRLL